MDIIYLDLHVQNQLFKNLHTRGKIQVYMKHHPTLGPGSAVGEKGKKRAQRTKRSELLPPQSSYRLASLSDVVFSSKTFSNNSAIS